MGMGLGIGLGNTIGASGRRSWSTYWETRFPSALSLTVDSDTQITATWTNNGTQDYDNISIERSIDGVTYTEHTTAVAGATTKALTGLSGAKYYIRLKYVCSSHYSAYTDVVDTVYPIILKDGNTVAWYKHNDPVAGVKINTAPGVNHWLDKMNYAIGAELVNQATWFTAAYWNVFSANWSQVGNTLVSDGTSGNLRKDVFLTVGLTYQCTISVVRNGGSLIVLDGITVFNNITASGTYTFYLTATAAFFLCTSNLFNGSVTALSIKQVSGNHLTQQTAAAKPTYSAADGVLFDGVNDFMKATAFTLNQPEFIYFVGRQVTWTADDVVFDGNADNSGKIQQVTGTPRIQLNAGSGLDNDNLVVNTFSIIRSLINGANSSIQINKTAAVTGDAGAANMGGFTLGRLGSSSSNYGNVQAKEIILRKAADNAAVQGLIYDYLEDVNEIS